MEVRNLIKPMAKKPKSQAPRYSAAQLNILRDQFTIQTWLSLGALLQTALILLLPFHYAILPPILLLTLHLTDTLLVSFNLKRNPFLHEVLPTKFCAQIPSPDGSYGATPSSSSIVVFLLGAKFNHPAGVLAPNIQKLGNYAQEMYADVEAKSEQYGLLGQSFLINNDRSTKNELVQLMYFRDVEGLHRFAHDRLHREAWDWYNRTAREHNNHFSIWHETYVVPAGNWETIYAHSAPTGLAATFVKKEGGGEGEGDGKEAGDGEEREEWLSPIVDARRGAMKTALGRMARSEGKEHEGYQDAAYQDIA